MYTKNALRNFLFWVGSAIVVNIIIYYLYGIGDALEFLGGYVIELSLSVDNLFLFLVIFSSFGVPINYQHRVLNYGIIGAILLRFIFIFLGIVIVNKFHWLLYIFGFILIVSSIKLFTDNNKTEEFRSNVFIRLIQKVIPITNRLYGEKFLVNINGHILATPLMLVLILIESSDIIFALDSIPAIFSITTKPLIVYSSNILAILGLRSLYFLLVKLDSMFKCIRYGVGFILMFTGIKLLILYFNISIPTLISLLIIFIILLLSILFSLIID